MLIDKYNRNFSYLRLSVTDLCNFNCSYCLPDNVKKNYLSLKEIYNLISCLSDLGVKKVRITGGEPTIRNDFLLIGKTISSFKNIKHLVFTTNGYKLSAIAKKAVESGFNGVNISLDTLNKIKFSTITGRNYLLKVLEGIYTSLNVGLKVKVNVVLSNFFSFDDFENFYSIIKYKNITIRFIEQMETTVLNKTNIFSSKFLFKFLKKNGWKKKETNFKLDGPAIVFSHADYLGQIGIINPYSSSFCSTCNRLRVSALGKLFLCLFGSKSYDIRSFLESLDKKDLLKSYLIDKINEKFYSHNLNSKKFGIMKSFSSIGG